MQQNIDTMPETPPNPFRTLGFWAVLVGAIAVGLVFVQMVGPTLEPQPSAATQVGEMAGEIKRSAWRTFLGLPKPEPDVKAVSVWNYLAIAAPILGIAAIVLSLVSGAMREDWRYPVFGASLGAAAIVFQYVWWIALLMAGMLILAVIIAKIGDIFSF